MVELGTHRTSPKGCVLETLHLRLRAPYFYPNGAADKAAIQLVEVQSCELLVSHT